MLSVRASAVLVRRTLKQRAAGWPAGKIFLQGDGTGLYDSSTTIKAIVGGTGPYAGKVGYLDAANGKYYFHFTNW